MTAPTPEQIDAFKTAWAAADERGEAGSRTIAGLTAALAVPTKQRDGDQVLPSGDGRCVQDQIIAEMEESKRVGLERYGSTLRTFNGRRSIQDAAEEARDLYVYLTQIRMEVEAKAEELVDVVAEVVTWEIPGLSRLAAKTLSSVIVERIHGHLTVQ